MTTGFHWLILSEAGSSASNVIAVHIEIIDLIFSYAICAVGTLAHQKKQLISVAHIWAYRSRRESLNLTDISASLLC